jgi:hypothetical protein
MLSRVPVDEKGQFPVNVHLVHGLLAGFLCFNQVLFWAVGVLLVREARMEVAVRFFWLSGAAAATVWATLLWLHWKERAWRLSDLAMFAVGMALMGAACRRLPPISGELALSSLALLLWTFRGFLRKKMF